MKCMDIMNKHEAAVKEMEAAAVAYACSLWKVPMFAVKSVTDIVDGDRPPAEEFLANLGKATAALTTAISHVVDHMQGKTLGQLSE